MRTTIIKATFKGQNGSLGYNSGEEYTLKLSHQGNSNILIERTDGSGYCPYGSMIAFLENWDCIKKSSSDSSAKESQIGFVIAVKNNDKEYHLGRNDVVVAKIKAAVIYGDELHARHELDRVIREYKNTSCAFLNEEDRLSVKKIEINYSKQ